MRDIKYMGYVIMQNGKQDGQVRDRAKKRAAILGQVWGVNVESRLG